MKDNKEQIPLTEFDPDRKGIIEPAEHIPNVSPSPYCVLAIYTPVINKLEREGKLKPTRPPREIEGFYQIYLMEYEGQKLMVVNPGVGAPLAVGVLDEMIAFGCSKFVVCGAAGVLDTSLDRGRVIIPVKALRDEGTSFHYLPPSRFVEADREVVRKLEAVLEKNGVPYTTGTTWTTDAIFRETRGKVAKRRAEGCITVEMECAAFLAVAKFRNVPLGQYLEAYDDVSGETWDKRHVDDRLTLQEKLFWLSVEACLSL